LVDVCADYATVPKHGNLLSKSIRIGEHTFLQLDPDIGSDPGLVLLRQCMELAIRRGDLDREVDEGAPPEALVRGDFSSNIEQCKDTLGRSLEVFLRFQNSVSPEFRLSFKDR
jgi:hypothetical protein